MNSMILEMTHGFGKCSYAKWPGKRIIYSIPWQYHDTLLVAVGHLCKHCKFKYWSHLSHIICHSHRILLVCSPQIHRLGPFGSSSNSEETKVFFKPPTSSMIRKISGIPPVSTTDHSTCVGAAIVFSMDAPGSGSGSSNTPQPASALRIILPSGND